MAGPAAPPRRLACPRRDAPGEPRLWPRAVVRARRADRRPGVRVPARSAPSPARPALVDGLRAAGHEVLLPVVPAEPGPLDWARLRRLRTRWPRARSGCASRPGPRSGTGAIARARLVLVPALAVDRRGRTARPGRRLLRPDAAAGAPRGAARRRAQRRGAGRRAAGRAARPAGDRGAPARRRVTIRSAEQRLTAAGYAGTRAFECQRTECQLVRVPPEEHVPTYQYACTACDHRFEAVQSFTDASLTECPECAGHLRKVFSSVGIVFKGSGFYRTDSRNGGRGAASGERDGQERVDKRVGARRTPPVPSSSRAPARSQGVRRRATPSSGVLVRRVVDRQLDAHTRGRGLLTGGVVHIARCHPQDRHSSRGGRGPALASCDGIDAALPDATRTAGASRRHRSASGRPGWRRVALLRRAAAALLACSRCVLAVVPRRRTGRRSGGRRRGRPAGRQHRAVRPTSPSARGPSSSCRPARCSDGTAADGRVLVGAARAGEPITDVRLVGAGPASGRATGRRRRAGSAGRRRSGSAADARPPGRRRDGRASTDAAGGARRRRRGARRATRGRRTGIADGSCWSRCRPPWRPGWQPPR